MATYRLHYSVEDHYDENVEFEAGETTFELEKGPVSDLMLEKWDGTKFQAVDIWNDEFYDIVQQFVAAMPPKKTLSLMHVPCTGNLASSQVDELELSDTVDGDMEFYPLLANLTDLAMVNMLFRGTNLDTKIDFLHALTISPLESLLLDNVAPIAPFYQIFESGLNQLTKLVLCRNATVPSYLPPTLHDFEMHDMPISAAGILFLLPAQLQRLDVSRNNLRELKTLAHAIGSCLDLNLLILDGNNFHVRELAQIFRLKHLTELKTISAVGVPCPLRQDIRLLLNALEQNTTLIDLDLAPAQLDLRLRSRLKVNKAMAEPPEAKKNLQVTENTDGASFNVDAISRVARFWRGFGAG